MQTVMNKVLFTKYPNRVQWGGGYQQSVYNPQGLESEV